MGVLHRAAVRQDLADDRSLSSITEAPTCPRNEAGNCSLHSEPIVDDDALKVRAREADQLATEIEALACSARKKAEELLRAAAFEVETSNLLDAAKACTVSDCNPGEPTQKRLANVACMEK